MLLERMREFVSEESAPVITRRRILVGVEDEVASHRVSARIHGARGFSCARISVDPHVTEVVPEAWFHEPARRGIERLTG